MKRSEKGKTMRKNDALKNEVFLPDQLSTICGAGPGSGRRVKTRH
jgi:hypothetical protein